MVDTGKHRPSLVNTSGPDGWLQKPLGVKETRGSGAVVSLRAESRRPECGNVSLRAALTIDTNNRPQIVSSRGDPGSAFTRVPGWSHSCSLHAMWMQ